jgi:F-type H+-transporting ATPase subunit beta
MSQAFKVAEEYTDMPGYYVSPKETLDIIEKIIEGKLDNIPAVAFYMSGGMDSIIKKAEHWFENNSK